MKLKLMPLHHALLCIAALILPPGTGPAADVTSPERDGGNVAPEGLRRDPREN